MFPIEGVFHMARNTQIYKWLLSGFSIFHYRQNGVISPQVTKISICISTRDHAMQIKRWWDFGMAHTIFLYLESQTKVCSQHRVLSPLTRWLSGWYLALHPLSVWLRICKWSMHFLGSIHICDQGQGRGRGFLATLMLSRWHMLSYTNDNLLHSVGDIPFRCIANQARRIKNTWQGDSHLKFKKIKGNAS